MWRPIFHASVVVLNSYTIWHDQMYVDVPFPAPGYADMFFKARSMFFTIWCLVLQTVYFGVSFLNDLYGTNEVAPRKPPFIRVLRDLLFSMAFPNANYVVAFFWSIYFIKKDFIFPDYVEQIVPPWANLVIHFFVSVFIIIELFTNRITFPSRKVALPIVTVFNMGYIIWMHVLYARTGVWPYPMLEVIDTKARILFLTGSMLFGLGNFLLAEKVCAYRTRTETQVNGVHKKRQ